MVDGNSTDETLALAKEFGLPVYKQVESDQPNVKINDFTAVRRKAISLARCDWVLDLDSDEFLSPELADEIAGSLQQSLSPQTVFNVVKKYVIRGKIIEHAFNYPSYNIRLFNKLGGAEFRANKLVHEKLFLPPGTKIVNLKNCLYSHYPDSASECIKKDNYYLKLAFEHMDADEGRRRRVHALKISVKYFLRALKIAAVSLGLYFLYGYQSCLPIGYWWRHTRYHLIIGFYRLRQAF